MEAQSDKTQVVTTFGDRLSTGVVNAGVWGAAGLAATTIVNLVHKYAFKGGKAVKLSGKTDWIISGAFAGAAGIYAFATADKAKELKAEQHLQRAYDQINDPNTTMTDTQREKVIKRAVEDVMDGDIPETSTTFQDKIKQERTAATATTAPQIS